MPFHVCIYILTVFLVVISGCFNSSTLNTVTVKGTVTVNGTPMEGVMVTFVPLSHEGREAYATTNSQGIFELTTAGAKVDSGALRGNYMPVFSKQTTEETPDGIRTIDHLPLRYAAISTSDIKPINVDGKTVFNFELSTQ